MAKGWKNESRRHSLARRGIKTAQKIPRSLFIHSSVSNKKMNPEVYNLRRKVIDIIHQAKKLTEIPRINVRITENYEKGLATALTGKNAYLIWIPETTFSKYKNNDLKYIIYHEILHTIYGIPHKKTGIMKPNIKTGYSSAELDKMFISEVKKVKGKYRLNK